jgi:hypothetical protein
MTEDKQKLSAQLPFEWAIEKILGPVFGEIGEDVKGLYVWGRDKIIQVAVRKVKNIDDGARANLRVARDVFWNGSYTDEAICAEYFGGILAASRSQDGKDDIGVFYVDIIKSLSSGQLKVHYILYRSLNKLLISDENKKNLNPAQQSVLQGSKLYIPLVGVLEQFGKEDPAAVLHGLNAKGLIGYFQCDNHELDDGLIVPYLSITPTSLGVQLFAIANNMFPEWHKYSTLDFGDFPDMELPRIYAGSLDGILEKDGLKKPTAT